MSSAAAAHLQAISDVELPAGLDRTKLAAWLIATEELGKAKERELELRKDVLQQAGFNGGPGTSTIALGKGYSLASEVRTYYKLDPNKTKGAIARLQALGAAGVVVADRLVKWKPELSVGEWKKLDAKARGFFRTSLTSSVGQPTLELRTPKAE